MDHEFGCACCGGVAVTYPEHFESGSSLVCARCGHDIGTVAELRLRAERPASAVGSALGPLIGDALARL